MTVFTGTRPTDNVPGMMRDQLQADRSTFVKTDGYRDVREELEHSGHILICGSPGSGKTTMSLMLMDFYERKKKFRVIFVDNLVKFDPCNNIDPNSSTLVVLDDVFGKFSQTNELVRCKEIFGYFDKHFRKRQNSTKEEHEMTLKVIMNSRTNIWNDVKTRLRKYNNSLFKESSIRKLMTFTQLKTTEKKEMLKKHLNKAGITLEEGNMDAIASFEYSTLGFPYICQLYADNHQNVKSPSDFFRNPWLYLHELIDEIFAQESSARAAVLLMMILNDGSLNLIDLLDSKQRHDTGLEDMMTKTGEFLPMCSSVQEINKAARSENETLLLCKGDIMNFSHPTIHDVVAFVVGDTNPVFVIEHCSLHFVLERTRLNEDMTSDTPSGGDSNSFIILLGPSAAPYLVKRLAKELVAGNIAMPLSHQCFSFEPWVKFLFEHLSDLEELEDCLHYAIDKTYGLGFLFWACYINPEYLCQLSLQKTHYDLQELLEGCLGCCMSGHLSSLKSLIDVCKEDKTYISITVGDILRTKHLYRNLSIVGSPTKDEPPKETARMHGDDADKLIHIAAANGFVEVVSCLLDLDTDIDIRGGNKMTALMHACYLGYSDMVHLLLEKRSNPELLDEEGDNCLHLACRGGHLDIIQILIGKKMNVNQRGEHERTPLMYAAYNGHEDVTRLLLDNGAEAEPDVSQLYNKENSLHLACVKGQTSVVRILIEKGKIDIECRSQTNRTPVMYACRNGNLETAKELVEKGADMNVLDDNNFTCLHLAAMEGDLDTVKWLVCSDSVSSVDCLNDKARTPLMFAMKHGNEDAVNYLIEQGADILKIDSIGMTNLHFAALSKVLRLVEFCLEKELNVDAETDTGLTPLLIICKEGDVILATALVENKVNFSKGTCLHAACLGGHMDMVCYLTEILGLDINQLCDRGRTAIMIAALEGHVDIVDYLINRKADITVLDEYNANLLHFACRGRSSRMVSMILGLRVFDVNCADENEMTPVKCAIKANFVEALDLLLEHKADLDHVDSRGGSYLHSASWYGVEEVCRKLIDLGVDINGRDDKGWTPLMTAMKGSGNQRDVIAVLLDRGGNIKDTCSNGDTCLHIAVRFNNVITLQILIERGMDVNTKGAYDQTPLMRACRSGSREMFDKLIENGADAKLVDQNRDTCLHIACMGKKDDPYIPQELVELVGPDVDARNMHHKTPVMYAVSKNNIDILSYLLSIRVDPFTLDSHGCKGNLIHYACNLKDIETKILDILLENGLDVDMVNRFGQTPVMCAARQGNRVAADLLIAGGADLRRRDNCGKTCYDHAMECRHVELANYLKTRMYPSHPTNRDWRRRGRSDPRQRYT